MSGFRGPSARDLAHALAARCEDVAQSVLADLHRTGSEWRGHASDGALWVIETRGRKRGLALCAYEPERSGDMLDFIAEACCDGNYRLAYRWACQYLGERAGTLHDAPVLRETPHQLEDEGLRKTARAKARYLDSVPWPGTPVERYLRGRSLAPALDLLNRALRFAPRCWYDRAHPEMPAMVAPIIEPSSRKFMGCHATFLEMRANGSVGKLAREPQRKVYGRLGGGVIPLTHGASGKSLRDAPENDGCLIAEGVENALSAAYAWPHLRAFAAVAVGNLAAIALPESQASVMLICDRDGENDGVKKARDRAVNRWLTEGRGIEIKTPPQGHKDFNAWLAELAKERAA